MNHAVSGIVLSAFSYAYIPMMIVWGLLTDRWGVRLVNSIALGLWSLVSILTGTVSSLTGLMFARIGLGVGESATGQTNTRSITEWLPRSEQGAGMAVQNAGVLLGPAISTLVGAWLVHVYGWRSAFYIMGILGFIWLLVWLVVYRSPENTKWLSKTERDFILKNREANEVTHETEIVQPMSMGSLLRSRSMWGLMLTQGCAVYTTYLFLTWLPSYLLDERHLKLLQVGILGALPFFVGAVVTALLGYLTDRLVRGKRLSRGVRRYPLVIIMILSAVILFEPFSKGLVLAEILLIVSQSCAQAVIGINYALASDLTIDRNSSARTFALQNVGGNVFGLLAPMITGFILQATNSYTWPFVLAGILLISGSICALFLSRSPLQLRPLAGQDSLYHSS